MQISLRLEDGWSKKLPYDPKGNTRTDGKYLCPIDGWVLMVAPHGGIYCDATHSLADVKKFPK